MSVLHRSGAKCDDGTASSGAVSSSSLSSSSSITKSAVCQSHDYLFKFIVIGDSSVGKSCLLHRLIDGRFSRGNTHTIGVEFGSKTLDVNGKLVNLQIWDTAGQERYRSVTRSYYRGATGAIVVYDITSRESFEHALSWLTDAKAFARQDVVVICVGNKNDLPDQRQVKFMEAATFAHENEILFIETSAATGEGVESAFLQVVKQLLSRIQSGEMADGVPGSFIKADATDASSKNHPSNQSEGCSC